MSIADALKDWINLDSAITVPTAIGYSISGYKISIYDQINFNAFFNQIEIQTNYDWVETLIIGTVGQYIFGGYECGSTVVSGASYCKMDYSTLFETAILFMSVSMLVMFFWMYVLWFIAYKYIMQGLGFYQIWVDMIKSLNTDVGTSFKLPGEF